MNAADPTPKRTRRKDARPGELLGAALDLFVEHGYAGTRVEAVASRAGVSKGTLFLYFPSKEDLFKAVVRENITGKLQEWTLEFESFAGSTAELVRYGLEQWWQRIGATKISGITHLVMREAHQFPEIARFYQQEVIAPANLLLKRMLQRGIDRHEFRPIDLDHGIYGLIAPMIFLVQWKHSMSTCAGNDTTLDPLTFIRTQTDLLLLGLQTRTPMASDPARKPTETQPR
jgi:TetR/AcrR family transcriptional regulator